jgi:hypothetical protein
MYRYTVYNTDSGVTVSEDREIGGYGEIVIYLRLIG